MPEPIVVDHPVARACLGQLREASTGLVGFRAATARLAPLLVAEATRGLRTEQVEVTTPVDGASVEQLLEPLTALVVLRAGLGLLPAVLEQHPDALVGFLDVHRDEESLAPVEHRRTIPDRAGRDGLVLEPMLATGGSGATGLRALLEAGVEHVTVVAVVATEQAIERLRDEHLEVGVVTAAIDPGLTDAGYITPGLGDFGDRLLSGGAAS